MKTLAFVCLLFGISSTVMSAAMLYVYHNGQPLVHSLGSLLLGLMMYSTIDGGPDVKT